MGKEEITATILSAGEKEVVAEGNRKDSCVVAELKGQKPMILNVTNCKAIAELAGSDDMEDWAGKAVTIYVAHGIKAFGKTVDALRIKTTAPKAAAKKAKDDFNPKSEGWDKAIAALEGGAVTLDQVEKKYSVSADSKKLLKAAADKAGKAE